MDSASPEEYKKHVKVYITVFVSLAILTVATVGASYLKLPVWPAIILGLIIASIKASLVMGYFMHLISEKKIIIAVLILTAIFFVALLIIPALTELNRVS